MTKLEPTQKEIDAAQEMLAVLKGVYLEVMDNPPRQPFSSDSYLPPWLRELIKFRIEQATGKPILEALEPFVS